MKKELEVVILVENRVEKRRLLAEHGLAFWLRYGNNQYLFDTGQGLVIEHNARELGIDLAEVDSVILSHGHDDHTGGLQKMLELNPELGVVAHRDIFVPKYKLVEQGLEFIGNEVERQEIANFHDAAREQKIENGFYQTGEVLTADDGYQNKKYIVKKDKQQRVDPYHDDISLYVETDEGLVILLGCAHKGVINILEHIRRETGGGPIKTIMGGMHLKHTAAAGIQEVIDYLAGINFEMLVPLHCTGNRASIMMKDAFADRVNFASLGDRFKF